MASRNPKPLLFVFFSFLFFGGTIEAAHNFNLDISSFTFQNFTLLGDSYLRNGVVGLTRELGVPSSSSGSVICTSPVPFFDPATNISASFSTRFSFSITNINPPGGSSSYGDGLTFFLSPNNYTLGSSGGYLGLVNSSQLTQNKFIAIEFDTRLDPLFSDPDDNHVGLDIESLVSIKTADVSSRGIDLKSGNSITAWIDYDNHLKNLKLWLSYSTFKPHNYTPALSLTDIDLSRHFQEFMYVGFSASTEGSTELHFIKDWTFHTSGFEPVNQKRRDHPYNVSDDSIVSSLPVIPIPTTLASNHNRRHRKIELGLGIALPSFFCLLGVVFVGCIFVKKLKKNNRDRTSFKPELLNSPREFSYMELKAATKGFHASRILGYGSFGTVYKADFAQSGMTFAVKRSKHTHEGKTEFIAELSIIACLRHKNLVQLQGWCTDKGELLLVYEFMPNGSLDTVLYQEQPRDGTPLPWSQRYNIALGIASVLSYLHQECEQQVIHRDIKTSNIMLDGNYNPRLGDFGLARLMEHDKSPVSTLTAGTMGYLAPEYLQYGKATERTDVFSFGVVLLEVACGRRPIEKEENSEKMVNLVDWVWGMHSEGKLIETADKRLNGEFNVEEMTKLLLVGLSCANPSDADRPSMRRVLQILNNEAELVPVPKTKPSMTFSSSLPLSIDDIFSDDEKSEIPSPEKSVKPPSPLIEISIS